MKKQTKTFTRDYTENGKPHCIVAEVRHDDECGNGHNTFAVTATIYGPDRQPGETPIKREGKILWPFMGGCCHSEVARHFPELAPMLKWHLCSTDGPMHYVANALYWAGLQGYCNGKPNDLPNAEHLKSTIAYGALPEDSQVDPMELAKAGTLSQWLQDRLPALLAVFRRDVEAMGFQF